MMHFRTLLISIFYFLSLVLWAKAADLLEPGFYFGYIEEVYPIAFEIVEEDDQLLSGKVIFPLSGDSILIEIDDLGDRLMLTEFDPGQAVIGFYFLKKVNANWVGNWQSRDGSQTLSLKMVKTEQISDWREKLLVGYKDEKWLKKYRFSELNNWTDLHILRQAGNTASATLSHESGIGNAIYLRGDCLDYECQRLLFLNKSGEEDLLLEVNFNGKELNGFYFYKNQENAFNAEWRETVQVYAKYAFNQWLVFDALYPATHPLMAAALEERIAIWMSKASAAWLEKVEFEHPTVWDRFSSRHYVWTEIIHFNEYYLSGYIEWIQNDESKKMSSFLFDRANVEWYWGEDLDKKGLHPYSNNDVQVEINSNGGAIYVIVPGGWQKITTLDRVEGRRYHFYNLEDFEMRFPRSYRKWFRL